MMFRIIDEGFVEKEDLSWTLTNEYTLTGEH